MEVKRDTFYRDIEFSQTPSRVEADEVVQIVERLEELEMIHGPLSMK